MSTVPFWMNVSRLAETASTKLICSGFRPRSAAMILPISTSKPVYLPPAGSFSPIPGWSILMPMVILPALFSFSIVVPAAKDAEVATVTDGAGPLSPEPSAFLALVQADSAAVPSAAGRAMAAMCLVRIGNVPPRGFVRSVMQDLGQEVPGPVGLGGGEELL